MSKPVHGGAYTVEDALALARDLKYGPLPAPSDPTPAIDEAIAIIQEAGRTCGHTWLTGDAAVRVLQEAYLETRDCEHKTNVKRHRRGKA
jgi:hypothetical protein